MKKKMLLILVVLMNACHTPKPTISPVASVPRPTYIQPDTCLTDKQFKQYLAFVKDSMKIEAKKEKVVLKFDSKAFEDSLKTVRAMFDRQLKEATKKHKQDAKVNKQGVVENGKTERKQTVEENKTTRNKDKQDAIVAKQVTKQDGKTARVTVKQQEKTKRGCKWWLWLSIGFAIGRIPWRKIFQFAMKFI